MGCGGKDIVFVGGLESSYDFVILAGQGRDGDWGWEALVKLSSVENNLGPCYRASHLEVGCTMR